MPDFHSQVFSAALVSFILIGSAKLIIEQLITFATLTIEQLIALVILLKKLKATIASEYSLKAGDHRDGHTL